MRRIFLSVLFVIFAISIGTVYSGVKIISTQKLNQMGGMTMNQTIYVARDQVRIDIQSPQQQQQMIFNAAKNVFWIINTEKGTYSEITQADLDKMAGAISQAMKMMKERLKNLPPEQQKMMESVLKKRGMDPNMGAAPTVSLPTYKKVRSGVKINGFITDEYTGYQNNQKTMEAWFVSPAKIGLKKSDMAVFKKMSKFFSKISRGKSLMANFDDDKVPGYPVKQIFFSNGKPTMEMEVKQVQKTTIDAKIFKLPPNLKKQNILPGMPE